MGVDPFAIQAKIASGDVQCGVCHGKGSTKFQPAHGQSKLADRTCESCYGSGKERISPELKQKAADSLGKYCQPQLKQIEVQGGGGGPIHSRHEFVIVRPGDIPPEL